MRNKNKFESRDSLDIKSLNHLSKQLGIPKDELLGVEKNIDDLYNSRTIKSEKDDGTIKKREIYQASYRLENILKAIDDYLLKTIRLPDCVHATRKKHSNITNAEPHVGRRYIQHFDIKDCYPSITRKMVIDLFRRLGCTQRVTRLIANICTINKRLPQGFNTSNRIAVLTILPATERIRQLCVKQGLKFTIFVDDLYISGNKPTSPFAMTVEKIINGYGFKINNKTKCMTQNERQMVTGVVVNKKVNIDRDTFRELKSRLHICKKIGPSGLLGKVNSRNGKAINTTEDLRIHLRGKLNYFNNINPQKTGALIKTYNEVEW